MADRMNVSAPAGDFDTVVRSVPSEALIALDQDAERAGGSWEESEEDAGAVGYTMYDLPNSVDHSITVLLPRDQIEKAPSQAIVRIESRSDGRTYLGVVVKGPFAEPDGLRADAPLVVTTAVRGGIFMPKYHGRVQVQLLGEEVDGVPEPPRFRPLPNSRVFVLDEEETAEVLSVRGDLRLGLAVGHERIEVGIPSDKKGVLPRHTGIIGTTGGGKSTTVAGLIAQAQRAGFATILLDVEGEYTFLGEPTEDPQMLKLLNRRGFEPAGVLDPIVFHLVGHDSSNPTYRRRREFSLRFSDLSPYTVIEILDLNEAQQERYLMAHDFTVSLLRRFSVSQAEPLVLDEFETGFPGMKLDHVIDVAGAIETSLTKGEIAFRCPEFADHVKEIQADMHKLKTSHPVSWLAVLKRLWRLQRLNVFDNRSVQPLNYERITEAGQVSVIDLSDTDSPDLNNLVIADILRGVQRQQEAAYAEAEDRNVARPKTLVIIEEAHEFLARERINRMQHLFGQVARIAKRGRKRWLGLVFVTQLPQHLPDEVFGLVNNWIIHKVSDAGVVSTLKRSVGGIDDSLWDRLPNLAPGQAIVSFGHMQRPVLTSIDPTPAKLRMVE